MLTTEEKIKLLTQLRNGYPVAHEWEQDYPYDIEIRRKADEFIKELQGPDLKDFDAKNIMMTVKYWPEDGESGSPKIVQDVTSIKRDGRTGDFIIGTIFDDIRIPCKKFETVIEVGA